MKKRSQIITRKKMTMAQIAEVAGVSVPTVSKVLRRQYDGSQATRERVEQILLEHGYLDQRALQRARNGEKTAVCLVLPLLESSYELEILRGVDTGLNEINHHLILIKRSNEPTHAHQWLMQLSDTALNGVILVFGDQHHAQVEDTLQQQHLPFVIVDHLSELGPTVPSVGINNFAGGRSAVAHLFSLGHRRIGIITGPLTLACARDRLAGYHTVLSEEGFPVDSALIRHGVFEEAEGIKSGYQEANALLNLPDPPTAIFASNDTQAIGVYKALFERGIRIPQDISVIGFDDIPIASQMLPTLTTVRQPLFEMGRTATSMLLRLLENKPLDSTRVELPTSLIIRQSCAKSPL
ncbi:LacI family DNA-binding transcriptional regulator [Tengunoibacter tsumagoiensis]|uniref:Transcriptional regulator n=1 Tax=Tengunoibacter tsumagoiensis TaxID=2014871 RepID=A0A402A7K8_9CHLR|nr:LacI family DNA-binding transcriptional regulator [Tengunoibacter tsumagoiensis]GCE15122.1 transcriptional regulator [Tengunoibacter tsumagoiensis]